VPARNKLIAIKKNHFVFVCSFFFCLGGTILNFSLIYRLTDRFSFSPGQIGTYLALGQLFYFFGCNLYHRFGSTINPAKIFTAASVLVFFSALLLTFVRLQGLIYFSYWILQLATSFFWPPVLAWLTTGLSGKKLNREITIYSRSWMAASLIGPPMAGYIYRWNSLANFLILNLCYFFVLVLLFFMWSF
jgi:MFS family permease